MRVLNLVSDSAESSVSIHHVHRHIEQQLRVQGVVVDTQLLAGSSRSDFGDALIGDPDALRRPRKHPIAYRRLRYRLKKRLLQGLYDNVIADGLLSANLLLDVQRSLPYEIACILVIHGRVKALRPKLTHINKAIKRGVMPGWRFVAVSKDSADHFQCQLPDSLPGVQVVENCIDSDNLSVELLDVSSARKALGLSESALVLGAIGRMSPEKDYLTLVRAFARVTIEQAVLVMIGDGKESESLRREVKQLGIEERVVFTGFLSNAKRYLRALDGFVMTSKTEGSPVALLEAMAASRAIVCSDIPPLVAVLPDNYPYVFHQGDPEALAACLSKFAGLSEPQRSALGNSLEVSVRHRFSPASFGKKYHDVLLGRYS